MKSRLAIPLVVCLGTLTACLDLDIVSNQNAPRARDILSDPATLEMLVAGTWQTAWKYNEDLIYTYQGMGLYGLEANNGTASYLHMGGGEPKEAYSNDEQQDNRRLAQEPWYKIYEGIDDAVQALRLIEQEGMKLEQPDRARAWAYLNMGTLYSMLALIFDQASISLPSTDRSKADWWHYKPYPEVAAVAIQLLEKAIEIAETAEPFQTPSEWASGVVIDNALLSKIAHSYIARTMVLLARTPEERRDVSQGGIVDWARVIEHVDRGITEDFAPMMDPNGIKSAYIQNRQSFLTSRASNRLIGPADISGAYAEWMAKPIPERARFVVVTHDRRITGAEDDGTPAPTAPGTYFRYTTSNTATWPTYLHGHYYWYRYEGRYREGRKTILSVDEMNLFKAEAYYRLGRYQEAADLINITRVGNGKLPPVTAAGIAEGIDDCVPRSFDGTECGTLLDALHHERMIENTGLSMYYLWWDRRGFGTLAKGTPVHLPVPARELFMMQQSWYTTGGDYGSAADGIAKVR